VTRRARAGAWFVLAVLVAVTVVGVPARAAHAGSELPEVDRVVVLSVPGVTWEDIVEHDLPALRELVETSAVANLAPRVEKLKTDVGDGYATVGAGTRALGRRDVAGLAFDPAEATEGDTAAAAYERQHGKQMTGALAHLRFPILRSANAGSLYDAEVGALGDALEEGGVHRGVVANADRLPTGFDPSNFHREAALAMVGTDGQVPCGTVSSELLRPEPAAPFGVALDVEIAARSAAGCLRDRSVVLVEASDLPRTEDYAGRVGSERFDDLWGDALERADRLAARLLEEIDPERDAVVLVAPSAPQTDVPRLTVFAVRAPGLDAGLLTSGVTRQTGFVSIVDVAPTIASLVRAPLTEEDIEGRAVSVAETGGDIEERMTFLVDADADARFRDRTLLPFMALFISLIVLLAAGAAWGIRRGRMWPGLEPLSLALLAVLPLTYWSAVLPFRDWGSGAYYLFTLGGGLLIGAGAWLARRRLAVPLVIVLAFMVATTAISVGLLDSRLQLSTVFGDSPIVAGRFSGINNVTFSQLMVAAILLAAFIRPIGRAGRWLVGVFFVFVALLIGAPMWGADVGGVLAGFPALALTFTLLGGWRVRIRTVVTWGLVTLVAVLALGLLDLTRDPSDRTHLGRLFERVAHDGWDGFVTVVGRKLNMNFATLTSSVWRFLFIPVLLLAAYVVWRAPGRFKTLRERIPTMEPAFIGIGAAALLGYALNDSGIAVPGVMLAVLTPATVYLLTRVEAPDARLEPPSADGAVRTDGADGSEQPAAVAVGC
jgi:hypothetical protein